MFNEIADMVQFYLIFILKIVVECPEEIFKELLSSTINLYDNSREYFS